MTKTVLVIGSAPDALNARGYDVNGLAAIVTINNAWRVRRDWTHLVHAGDFPDERRPVAGPGKSIVSYEAYVPANNAYGGIVYAGGTMAFSAAYWVLHALRPDVIAFCGCDMIYDRPTGPSHFYGQGTADPLRPDPTLQSLEAKANRLMLLAARRGCLCVNLSQLPTSRLTFPRLPACQLGESLADFHREGLRAIGARLDGAAMEDALACEAELGLVVPGGDYWNYPERLDDAALAAVDRLWLSSLRDSITPGSLHLAAEASA